jgi:predicted enzyme related to lactoylglutathione lyase
MNITIVYTRLLVQDWKACVSFYKNVMEFTTTVEDEVGGYAEFAIGDMKLGLFPQQEMAEILASPCQPTQNELPDRVALIFVVKNLDEECQRLQHKGVHLLTTPTSNPTYSIKTTYLRDPAGTLIGLYQPLT